MKIKETIIRTSVKSEDSESDWNCVAYETIMLGFDNGIEINDSEKNKRIRECVEETLGNFDSETDGSLMEFSKDCFEMGRNIKIDIDNVIEGNHQMNSEIAIDVEEGVRTRLNEFVNHHVAFLVASGCCDPMWKCIE